MVLMGESCKIAMKSFLVLAFWNIALVYCFRPMHTSSLHPNFRRLDMVSLSSSIPPISPRIQKIKEITLQREILNDISASEFALRLDVKQQNDTTLIDYERLIQKLDRDLELLQNAEPKYDFTEKITPRLLSMREDLTLASNNLPLKNIVFSEEVISSDSTATIVVDEKVSTTSAVEVEKLTKDLRESLRITVREDGTVDWDNAIASGKQVAKIGTELWERLNGKAEEEGMPSIAELFSPAQAKIPQSPAMESLSRFVTETRAEIDKITVEQEGIKARLRQNRRDGRGMSPEDITTLRRLDLRSKEFEKRLKLFTLNLDMEKICAYLLQELEASTDPSDQRLLVAEVTLIDKQLSGLMAGLQLAQAHEIDTVPEEALSGLIALIDDDELVFICNEVNDLKTRLGLDTQLISSLDWGSLGKVVSDTLAKVKAGLAFFSEGTKVLVSDVQYGWQLTLKAIQGYTLKPRFVDHAFSCLLFSYVLVMFCREVNALRRTGKDLLTLIPFTIILIIPLSPIGHVLVFGFIQRFFPEFYPSCYTEKRLKLSKLFAEVERKKEDQLVDLGSESALQDWTDRIFGTTKTDYTKSVANFFSNAAKIGSMEFKVNETSNSSSNSHGNKHDQ